MWIPNFLTLLRLLSAVPLFFLIRDGWYGTALILALAAGASDGVDGFLAKKFHWQSRLGGLIDPLADKCMLLSTFVALTAVGEMPGWLMGLVLARDLIIVGGALLYHYRVQPLVARPSGLSKLTTLMQILLAVAMLVDLYAGIIAAAVIHWSIMITAAVTVASGFHYALVWSGKARAKKSLQGKKAGAVDPSQR